MPSDGLNSPSLAPLLAIEKEILAACRGLRILTAIQWPRALIDEFLEGHRVGNPRLPVVKKRRPPGLNALIDSMTSCMARIDQGHPLGEVLWKTAWSYSTAARMLQSMGTPQFTEHSIELYGSPDRTRQSHQWSDLDAAEFLLERSSNLMSSHAVPDVDADMSATELARRLRARIKPIFVEDRIRVVVTDELASKAAAGSKRVRLRRDAKFSELDLDQLFEHEVMTHSATKLNGLRQPHLDVLGLGSPRTTRTQEGLATLSELMTGVMDLTRLRRIALRVRAVSMALSGADFIEVFRMFVHEGQSEEESAQSAARVFRGGDPRGGIAFTKDGTYIAGLLNVHTFLRVAIRDGRPELIPLLFSGRVTLGDVVVLAPLAETGVVAPPHYVPRWASDLRRLTASLSFSAFLDFVDISELSVDHALGPEERAIDGSRAAAAVDE